MATRGVYRGLEREVKPDYEGLIDNVILRKGPPRRVHYAELFLDGEIQDAVDRRFRLTEA